MLKKTVFEGMNDDTSLAFHLAPVGLLVSRERVLKTCNDAICDMFGYSKEELLNQSVEFLYPSSEEFQNSGERAAQALRDCGYYSDDRIMRMKDGGLFWCHVSGRTLDRTNPFASSVWMFENTSRTRPVTAELTARERELAQLLLEGMTSKEIARILDMSHRTVEAYRSRLMRKYGASSLSDLIARLLGR
jgi:PAS domain S-box-containing protein